MSTTRPQGDTFDGTARFLVGQRLGEGGMGVVYRAIDRERAAPVALKTLSRVDAAGIYRFKAEFRALSDLAHPNVVQLYDLVSHEGSWFFTMELVEGETFTRWVAPHAEAGVSLTERLVVPRSSATELTLEAGPPLRVELAATVLGDAPLGARQRMPVPDVGRLRAALRQLAEGVMAIHGAGKLHRDLKPSNVLVTGEGRVVVLDFGLVRDFSPTARVEVEDQILGTPAYMAPEQAGARTASPASDWYAVGTMLYECLTGVLPFEGSAFEVLMGKQRGGVMPPSLRVTGVPEDLEALCMDLLRLRPDDRPSGALVLSRLALGDGGSSRISGSFPISTRAPFVGRTEEIAILEDALRASRQGASAVFVSGRSGMGKTALVQCFLELVRQREDAIVLSGRCYERESVPYKAFDTVVDALTRTLRTLDPDEVAGMIPAGIQELSLVFPVLRNVPAFEAVATSTHRGSDPHELRRRAFAALKELLASLAQRGTLIVHLDDLQWGDLDSAQLLLELLAPPDAPKLLLLGTHRDEDAARNATQHESPMLGALLHSGGAARVRAAARFVSMAGLSDAEAIELAQSLGGARVASRADIAQAIAREAGGSPLFVAELVRHEEARAARGEDTLDRRGPATLEEAILARFDDLPAEARRVIEVLSVAGRPVERDVALTAADLSATDYSTVSSLRSAKLVSTRSTEGREALETFHDRIREAIAARLPVERHRAIHAKLGAAMLAAGSHDSEGLLEHFLAAGDEERARGYAVFAADAAALALAFRRAAQLYRVALDLGAPDPTNTLRRKLGDALANAGLGAEAAAAYLGAVPAATEEDGIELRRLAAESYLKSGHDEEGIRTLREVLRDVGLSYPATPQGAIASLLWSRGRVMLSRLSFVERAERDIPRAELARADVAFTAAIGLSMQDTLRGADFVSRHLLLALKTGEPFRICRAIALEASMTASAGSSAKKRSRELVNVSESLSFHIGDPNVVALAKVAGAYIPFFMGNWREAINRLEDVEVLLRDRCHGVAWETAATQVWICNSLILSGELALSTQRVHRLLKEATERGDRFTLMHIIYPLCVGYIVEDDVATARRIATELVGDWTLERYTNGHWAALVSHVSLDRYTGDGRAAWARMSREWKQLERQHLLRVQLIRVFGGFERALCAISAALSAVDSEREALLRHAERDAKHLLSEGPPYATAMGDHIDALIKGARGRRGAALAALARADAGMEATGMRYLGACIRHRRGEALGGEAGRALCLTSSAFLRAQGIRRVDRCLAMSAPSLGDGV